MINILVAETGPAQPVIINAPINAHCVVPKIEMNNNNQISSGNAKKISITLIKIVSSFLPAWKPKYAPIETPITV
ncbi:hypothetical protein COL447_16990 [Helicobacter pylori]